MTHPVIARLRDPNPSVRREACREAADDPSAVLLVDALAAALGDPVAAVGRAASVALAGLAGQHDVVSDVLRRSLHGDDSRARFGAAQAQALIAPPEPALLPALVEAMGDEDDGTRWAAARIFVDLGRLHGEPLPVAFGLARGDPSPVVRRMAVLCAIKLAPHEDETASVLLEATRDEDGEVRRAALTAMAGLTDPPAAVGQALLDVLNEPRSESRALAATALGELGARRCRIPAETTAALEAAASSGEPVLKACARRALERRV